MIRKHLLICAVGSLSYWSLSAQDYPVTDRSPAYATSYVMESGTWMIEAGYYGVYELEGLPETNLNGFNIQARYGIGQNTEIRINTGFVHLHPGPLVDLSNFDLNGLNSVHLGLKTLISQETDFMPGIALLIDLELPGPGNGFYTPDHLSPSIKMVVEKFINTTFILGANLGYLWRDDLEETFTYVVSLRTAISKKVSFYSEFYGQNSSLIPSDNYIDWALEFWFLNDFVLDVTYGRGISTYSDDSFISLGGAWRIN